MKTRQSKEIEFSWRERPGVTGSIIIRRSGSDTFIGELASKVMHVLHMKKIYTFAKRFYYIQCYVVPIISEKTGVSVIHSK